MGSKPERPTDHCHSCGAVLARDARGGLCPGCLFAAAHGPLPSGGIGSVVGVHEPEEASSPRRGETPERPHRFGDYELLEEIARGGMGVVYRARQVSLDRVVALKLLLGGPLSSPEVVKRFRLEAAAAGGLQHPNIVAIHEVGLYEGQHFIAMDYVDGPNLATVLSPGPLPARRAAGYLKTVAKAIDYAHSKGILHRDLKPSNILLDANDQPRVTDFGLAKKLEGDADLTVSGQVLGSPNYMPPEQAAARRGNLDRTADVYSLGAILYHLLTGRPPFQAVTVATTLEQVRTAEPVSPRRLNASLPRDLETICLKCLEKDPERRYPTPRALAWELGRFLNDEPIEARPVGALGRTWRWCRRRPVVAGLSAAVGVLLVTLAIGSTIAAFQFRREAQRTSEALRQAYLNEARLRRSGGQLGQRFRTLEILGQAAAIRPEIQLRNEAIRALTLPDLQERQRFEWPPAAVASFDPSTRFYARCDAPDAGEISVRRVADDHEIARLPGPGAGGLFHLCPEGRFLQTTRRGSNGLFGQVWDVAGATLVVETNVTPRAGPVEVRDDGLAAFGRPDGSVFLYDLDRRSPVGSFPVGFAPNVLRFDPRDRYLVAGAFGTTQLTVLDLRSPGGAGQSLAPPGALTGGVDWSSDGRLLAVAVSGRNGKPVVQVWDWTRGQPVEGQILRGYRDDITGLLFVPDSDFVVANSWGSNLQFWSAEKGEPVLLAHFGTAMDRMTSDRLAIQLSPGRASIEEFAANREFRTFYGEPGGGVFGGMDLSPDGSLLALADQDGVRLWHIPSRTLLGTVPGPTGTVRFHPLDESLLMVGTTGVVRRPLRRSPADGRILVGPPEVLSTAVRHYNEFPLALSRDGSTLACAADNRVEILDWRDPSNRRFLDHGARVQHVSLGLNGTLAVTAGELGFKVWDLEQRKIVFQSGLIGYPFSSFSPDDQWLVLSTRGKGRGVGGGSHQIYRVAGWGFLREVAMNFGPWPASAFSPDGRLLALRTTETAIRLLETGSWAEVATLEAPTEDPFSWFTFSRDSSLLAVACDRHMAQLWDLRAIREQLVRIGLDWDHPPYPPPPEVRSPAPRLAVDSPSGTRTVR
ncbi:MAG: protein kinase [Verrucomicrobiales bacterium]|nr:protein kinase [Verrucomicrobiales bacterium]